MRKFADPMVPDTYYHIYNRACGHEKLFYEDRNYYYFMDLFEERLNEYVELYSFCLLPNHFHMLIKTKSFLDMNKSEINISKKFGNLFAAYAQSFNHFYHRKGNLFSQNFKRKPILSFEYLKTVIIYIHRNPMKHGLVENLTEWKHSSYLEHLMAAPRYCVSGLVIKWFTSLEVFKFCHTLDTESDLE